LVEKDEEATNFLSLGCRWAESSVPPTEMDWVFWMDRFPQMRDFLSALFKEF
jgi:hypothetical protein